MNPVFNALEPASVSLDLMAARQATPQVMAARQRARLTNLVTRAGQGSTLYRQRLRGVDAASARLELLPIVTRDELMQRFVDWVCDPALRLDALRAWCADPLRIGEPFLGWYVVWESSGSPDQAGVFDFQLRQTGATTLELWLPCAGAEGNAAMARARQALHAFARQQGLASLRLVGRTGVVLPLGRSGKVQRVLGRPG